MLICLYQYSMTNRLLLFIRRTYMIDCYSLMKFNYTTVCVTFSIKCKPKTSFYKHRKQTCALVEEWFIKMRTYRSTHWALLRNYINFHIITKRVLLSVPYRHKVFYKTHTNRIIRVNTGCIEREIEYIHYCFVGQL